MLAFFAEIEFEYPARLYWLAVLLLVGYFAYRTRVSGPLWRRWAAGLCRAAAIALLILAFAGVRLRGVSDEGWVVFVTDVSRSVSGPAREQAHQFIREAVQQRGQHPISFLSFAGRPGQLRAEFSDQAVDLDDLASDPAAALRLAIGSVPADCAPRVVLLTDGNDTRGDLARVCWGTDVPIHVKPLPAFAAPEAGVTALTAPVQANALGELPLEALVVSNREQPAVLELFRDAAPVAKREIQLLAGDNRVRFLSRLGDQEAAVFDVRLSPTQDTLPENNHRRTMVWATRRLKVLVVDRVPSQAEPLCQVLRSQGLEVTVQGPEQLPGSAADLEPFDLVILSDVAPKQLDTKTQVVALHRYVRDAGGGLIVLGGENTFGAAAYQDAALERLLPVRALQVREAERKSVRALVLVIDRSGSMQEQDRIGLAKQAAKTSVQLLEPQDKIGVIAFSDESNWVVPISPCSNKPEVVRQIDTLTPAGQTQMYEAVERAFLALEQTDAERRHVVLLTDGVPAPGDFGELAQRMAKAGITVSTVSIGADAEQGILQDIARIARGKHHRCENPADVPKVLSEETQAVVSRTGPKEFAPFVFRSLPGLEIVSAPALQGYTATDPKANAELLLLAAGGDPLLGWWRYGAGITAVLTADSKDGGIKGWYAWKGLGPFWKRLIYHAARVPVEDPLALYLRRAGTQATATLDVLGEAWTFLNDAQVQLTVARPDQTQQPLTAQQIAPGRYQAHFAAETPGAYVVAASVTQGARTPLSTKQALFVDYADELLVQPSNERLLRSIAVSSGGAYDPAPAAVFAADGRTVERITLLWSHLVLAALFCFVADVVLRRLRAFN